MAPLLHRRPLPMPLLLPIMVAASHGVAPPAEESYDSSLCLQQHHCGSLNISYPFYLYNETAGLLGNDGSYCGYPGLRILCNNDKQAVLQLDDGNYTVSGINYESFTISLADQEVFEDESCPRVDHNVTLPEVSWLTIPNTSTDYLVFFLGCNFSTTWTMPKTISPVTCPIFEGSGLSFVLPLEDVPDGDWRKACMQIFEAPVLKGLLIKAFFGCLCSDEKVHERDCSNSGASSIPSPSRHVKRTTTYIVAVSVSCLSLLCLIILVFCLTRKYGSLFSKSNDAPRIESFLQKNGNIYPKRYKYAEVKRMTNAFAVKLGQGGFGAVYRGNLSDGREVAVKMLKDTTGDGEEFMNEVASISRTSHVNIVTLLGFCLQGSKRALIYEYMPNGSLERYAFNRNFTSENTLTWEKLFDIAIGIARGLEYLHRGCNTRIVHFDIKPHNILLDQDFCPKVSDFGLAKLCLNKESAISIVGARGTIGYIAPEVYSKQFGTVSSKSDVYSYGMMVLEMVGARDKNTNANSESSSQYFPQWIYEHLDDYCISASEINGETTELVRKMIIAGLWCIQVIPTDRPTITRVVEMLEGSTSNLELPPKVLLT